ncbi:molybdopterin-guanine dinucleotide biosynthesis protein B [Candidatus Bathyarchaeota archaeon]|nr:molybdopterin-guanine dinucleotide biosynthesis protein B [Candidatus Bathyarchaeota archaeon]
MPLRICVVGFKNTGKTRLVTSIVSLLSSKGFRVAVIKHSHERIDLAVKDTARILTSNPLAVAYSSPYDNVLILDRSLNPEYILELLNPDMILYEGFKRSPYPKILTAIEEKHLNLDVDPSLVRMVVAPEHLKEHALRRYPKAVFSSLEDEKLPDRVLQVIRKVYASRLPGLNCGLCGYGSCGRYAELILKGEAEIGRCMVEDPPARLYVDWSRVELRSYPASVLKAILAAFTDTLKGVKKGYEFILASARIRKDDG